MAPTDWPLPSLLAAGLLALSLVGCPADDVPPVDDDDSSVPDDDDTAPDDDDSVDDDDAAPDDDDSLGGEDFLDATIPDFTDCSGNQFKIVLGDGTELGPFEGFFPAPTSFANNFPQFTIRTGTEDAWTALNGNYSGMGADAEIPFESPPSVEGNVVLQALLSAATVGTGPEDLVGTYGMPSTNLNEAVGGSVTFSSVPAPNAQATGSYSGIIQKIVSLSSQQVLLGVRGCFDAQLAPTDGG